MIALSWCQGWKKSTNTPRYLIFIYCEAMKNISCSTRINVIIRRISYNISNMSNVNHGELHTEMHHLTNQLRGKKKSGSEI